VPGADGTEPLRAGEGPNWGPSLPGEGVRGPPRWPRGSCLWRDERRRAADAAAARPQGGGGGGPVACGLREARGAKSARGVCHDGPRGRPMRGGPRQRRSAGGADTAATLSAVPRCRPLRASPPSTDAQLQVERRRRLRRPANVLILRPQCGGPMSTSLLRRSGGAAASRGSTARRPVAARRAVSERSRVTVRQWAQPCAPHPRGGERPHRGRACGRAERSRASRRLSSRRGVAAATSNRRASSSRCWRPARAPAERALVAAVGLSCSPCGSCRISLTDESGGSMQC
jgi:hypothetical protein